MKFLKKPVLIDAVQFIVLDENNIPPFIKLYGKIFPVYKDNATDKPYIIISEREKSFKAVNYDWIIKDEHDVIYPCKPDVFEFTYEKIIN